MYLVTFADGSIFEGGNPHDSKWNDIPDKPIKSIEYSLTPFMKYLFKDFESYSHVVERVRGVNKSLETITKVIIMGKVGNKVYQIMMDNKGSVFQLVVASGKEYSPESKMLDGKFNGWYNAKPVGGWKRGIPDGENPQVMKINL